MLTGDLVNSGSQEDYSGLERVLTTLRDSLGAFGQRPPILMVPGNHDVRWQSSPAARLLRYWSEDPTVREQFCNERQPYIRSVKKAFSAFNFFSQILLKHTANRDLRISLIPRYFSAIIR